MEQGETGKRGRGKGKRPAMRHITLRIPEWVLAYYDNDIRKMRDAIIEHTKVSLHM
jgi:hypothetical protein